MRIAILACLLLLFCVPSSLNAQWQTEIGWTQLSSEVGAGLETGAGIPVLLTEAPINPNGDFMPDTTLAEFSGKTITNGSNANNLVSWHATNISQSFFGNTLSIAPGITNITVFEVNDWINNKIGLASGGDPVAHPYKISNNSWVGSLNEALTTAISQRSDYIALQNQMTVIAGTNNGAANPLPTILSHTYNSLIVGRTDGGHAAGATTGTTYGPGRVRPDIVAPTGSTSGATSIVSSAAALLHQKAGATSAGRIDTMRAVILAGATKQEFPSWDRTTTRPMDDRFGAGELNVYNSYRIIEGGQFAASASQPTTPVGNRGWDYRSSITAGTPLYYDFDVAQGFSLNDFSIALTWNMQITDTNASSLVFAPSELLGNLNLDFFDSTGGFLGSLLDSSLSTTGNVEHLYFNSLAPGRYSLRVTSDTTRDYAIAWRGSFVAIPEPSAVVALMFISGFAITRRNRRV